MIGNLHTLNVLVVDSSMVRQVTEPQNGTVTRIRLGRADWRGPKQLRLGEELEQSSTRGPLLFDRGDTPPDRG
jgi:hypothetical protein